MAGARTPPRSSTCAATGTAACHRTARLPVDATLALSLSEATYLCERIAAADTATGEESLLGYLARKGEPAHCEFVWMHPQSGDFPPHISRWLVHMRNFSEALHGAALLYNLMLARLDRRDELAEEYRERLSKWSADLDARAAELARWTALTSGASCTPAAPARPLDRGVSSMPGWTSR